MNLNSWHSWLRIPTFLGILLGLWLPVAVPLYWLWGDGVGTGLAIWLYCLFVWLIGWWGRKLGHRHPYRHYGLSFSNQSAGELGQGLLIALAFFTGLMACMVWLGWLAMTDGEWWRAIPEGALIALAVGFAEELLFRGWLWQELASNGEAIALWISSLIFAALHFIKPLEVILLTWLQFPGLVLLGVILGNARLEQRISRAIGIHAGLVWGYYVVNTTKWLVPSGAVPEWVTGINNNPLAGGMGLMALLLMAWATPKLTPTP